jgi:hypothetical protein
MEFIINGLVNLIRAAVVNGFFVYIILLAMVVAATFDTFGNSTPKQNYGRKVASYVLGWLIAIFGVVMITATQGDALTSAPYNQTMLSDQAPISWATLILPALLGGVSGFGLIFLSVYFGGVGLAGNLIVTVVTAMSGLMLFLISLATSEIRSYVSIYVIAFAIGALVHIMVKGFDGPQNKDQTIATE